MKAVKKKRSLNTVVSIPGSKSISHRVALAAALAEGESRLAEFLFCEDTHYTLEGLRSLGTEIELHNGAVIVHGRGGAFPGVSGRNTLFLGNSGTSYRFLLAAAALSARDHVLTGAARLRERPVGELVAALTELGVRASYLGKEGYPPVLVKGGGVREGAARLSGNQSSQFVSALLLIGPCTTEGIEIEVTGDLVSRPYVDLTIEVMKRFGISVSREGYRYFKIDPGQSFEPCRFEIEGDVSNASYFWAAAAVTGGSVCTQNIFPGITRQGDIRLLTVLEAMGCEVERGQRHVTVQGRSLSGMEVDMNSMPDMVPTVAAIALFARGKTTIRNVPHLRLKESDRLKAVTDEWRRLGAWVEELPDGLIIHGERPLSGTLLDPHDDHRLAMALAVIGLTVEGIKIHNAGCVNKSFPGFWETWEAL